MSIASLIAVYYCHRCGWQVNALNLSVASQKLSIFDATWDLIDRLDLEVPHSAKYHDT